MHADPARRAEAWAVRRPGAPAVVVLALHALLVALMWQAMARRSVEVRSPQAALTWVRPLAPVPTPAPAAVATEAGPAAARAAPPQPLSPPEPRPAAPRPTAGESTWVTPLAAAPALPASAASAPPEGLFDSAATRAALRGIGAQPLLHERAAAATGTAITRTDTALAQAVSESAKPDCLRDEKAATGQVGPVALGGILGLPFLAGRVIRGDCAR